MRKTKKFLLIIIIVFLAICQVNNNVYSYKWKEVEELIDYEELEANQTPEKYDIEIDASKLIDNEKLPCIQTSIDTVLYEDNELSDIDFFDIRSKNNTNEALSDMVKTTFRVTLYLAAACLLTLLIYIAINMVTSSISPKFVKLPFGAKMIENKNKSPIPTLHDPNKNLRGRIAIEQWIVTVLLLAIILPLINLMIGFSYIITDATNVYSSKKDSDEDIIVYVRNANSSATTSGSGTNSSNGVTVSSSIKTESSEGDGYVETITLGERTFKLYKQNYYGSYINNYYYSQSGTYPPYTYAYQGCGPTALAIALSGYGINETPEGIGKDLLNKDTPSARIYLTEEAKNLGVGAKAHTYNSNYTDNYNDIKTALASGHTIVLYVGEGGEGYHTFANGGAHYIAVLGIDTSNDKVFVGNPNVQYFNGWIDLSTVVKAMGDNIPHMSGWIEICDENSQTETEQSGNSSSGTKTTGKISYTFKTSLEGLLMFQTQYEWSKYGGKNFANGVSGFILTLFKITVYVLFIVRTLIIAFLTAVAPVVILISGFMKVSGYKGIFMNWLKIYAYCIIIKPAISVIYYLLAKTDVPSVSEHPYYVILVIIIINILFFFTLTKLINDLRNNKEKTTNN